MNPYTANTPRPPRPPRLPLGSVLPQPRHNVYTCPHCLGHVKTVEYVELVTPAMLACWHCSGKPRKRGKFQVPLPMMSSYYHLSEAGEALETTHKWVLHDGEEVGDLVPISSTKDPTRIHPAV